MNLTLVINMMTAKALELLSMPEDEFNRRNEMEMAAEIERLRARVAELETINAMIVGTVRAGIVGELNEPATITHGHTPSAPPHDE